MHDVLERALTIKERAYGRDHAAVAITLSSLGTAYGGLGDDEKAQDMLERALAIKEQTYGRDHVKLAATLWNLARALGELGETVRQRDILERALAINQGAYGPDHSETVDCREWLAELARPTLGVNGGLAIVILSIVFTFVTYYMRHRRSDLLRPIRVGDGHTAATAAMVATLSRDVSSAEFASAECPICLHELCDGAHGCEEAGLDDDVVVLPCAHAFHGRCVRPWFDLAYADGLRAGAAPILACPVCRAAVAVSQLANTTAVE